jgi:AAT family amino acid transporter
MGLINLIAVKEFGEFEFWFALIKVVAIVAMIALGGSVIFFGFTNDWNPIGFSNLWLLGGFCPNCIGGMLLSL